MLSMPENQLVMVRDELEDHLRSRVDDLLITGTPEHEAIRVAVAELGETAELAKLISHAHSRANPRRRIMNIALMTVAVAGLSIGGISLQNTGATLVEENAAALTVAGAAGVDDGTVHAFGNEMKSAHAILIDIGNAFDRRVSFSRGSMGRENRAYLDVHAQFAGKFTFDQAIEKFRKQFDEVSYGYNLEITEDSVLYQTNDELERKRIEMRMYPSPIWITDSSERDKYAQSLTHLLEVKHDLRYASIEVIDEAIVVAATPEIHSEVVRFTADLNGMIEQRHLERVKIENEQIESIQQANEAREQALVQRAAQERRDFRRAVDHLQSEFDETREAFFSVRKKVFDIEMQIKGAFAKSDEQSAERVIGYERSLDELELEENEVKERYLFLRERLLASRYAELFSELE
jgi:hypothetical protein